MIILVYDGECPFCSRFVTLVRLRESVGEVCLVDARSQDPILAEIHNLGLNLDEGMVAKYANQFFHGDQVIHLVAMLSSRSGFFNRLMYWIFKSERRARLLYPFMVKGRNLALWFLGRQKIIQSE